MPTVSPRPMRIVTPCRTFTAVLAPSRTGCCSRRRTLRHLARSRDRRSSQQRRYGRARRATRRSRLPASGAGPRSAGRSAGRRRAARAYRRVCGLSSSCGGRARPRSTRPANSSVTRSQIWATTPRSWVTNSTAVPCALCMLRMSRRICFCTVTSSAVVGSSATIKLRLERERGGDQHALAHAAGELVRISCAARAPGRGSALRRAARARALAPRSRRARARAAGRRSSALRSAAPGLSAVIGSCGISAMRSPISRRSAPAGIVRRSRPSNASRRAVTRTVRGRMPRIALRDRRFAGAAFADKPAHLAAVDVERDVAQDRRCVAVGDRAQVR